MDAQQKRTHRHQKSASSLNLMNIKIIWPRIAQSIATILLPIPSHQLVSQSVTIDRVDIFIHLPLALTK